MRKLLRSLRVLKTIRKDKTGLANGQWNNHTDSNRLHWYAPLQRIRPLAWQTGPVHMGQLMMKYRPFVTLTHGAEQQQSLVLRLTMQ